MQRVTPDKGGALCPVEQAPREVFIPSLLHGLGEGTPVRVVTRLLVKQSTLALLYQKKTVPENWTVPCFITGRLVTALRNHKEFRMADHSAYIQEGRMEMRNQSVLQAEEALSETLAGAHVQDTCRLQRATKTGNGLWCIHQQ